MRASISGQLHNLLQGLAVTSDILEQSIQLVTNDNLDLGCAMIEQAATEKVCSCVMSFDDKLPFRTLHSVSC